MLKALVGEVVPFGRPFLPVLQEERNARGLQDDPPAGVVGMAAELAPFRLESAQPCQRAERVGIGRHVVPDLDVLSRAAAAGRDGLRRARFVDDHFGRGDVDIGVLLAGADFLRLRLGPTIVEPFPEQRALARHGAETDLQGVLLIELEIKFDLRGHLAQMHLHLLLQVRVTAQKRRQKLARRGGVDFSHALLEGERHERVGRPLRQAIEAVPDANELKLRPRMVGLGRKKEIRVGKRFAQAGGGDDLEIEVEPRAVAPVAGAGSGMKLRHDARAERTKLDRRAVLPDTAAALAPLREPGEQAAVVVQERGAGAVFVGEQQREEIAQPAEQHLVLRGEKLGPVGRLVAEAAHLEKITGTFLQLRRVDPQVDVHLRLERVEAGLDLPRHTQAAAWRIGGVLLGFGKPLEQLTAKRLGLLRALLLLEVGAVQVGLERGGNLAVVAAMDLARQPPGEFLGVGLAANGRADGGIEKIGQVDLRFLEQVAQLVEAVPLAPGLEKAGEGLLLGARARRR